MSRSEYYRIAKEQEDEKLTGEQAVINCFKKHKRNYGRIRIRKENERLKMENEILKKAAAYFAKHPADE